ncbi:hypothetical protein IFM47457_07687 [Aspergillus lentulus]|nr:hypothetical protein IFM47457_07687 [Aspergillus lentulus]
MGDYHLTPAKNNRAEPGIDYPGSRFPFGVVALAYNVKSIRRDETRAGGGWLSDTDAGSFAYQDIEYFLLPAETDGFRFRIFADGS